MNIKKIMSVIITLIICFTILPLETVSADDLITPELNKWIDNANTTWYDDEETEFHIYTAEQLAGLAKLVNLGKTMKGRTIYLEKDINLGDFQWTPIGTSINIGTSNKVKYCFEGIFDGKNHTISNLYQGSNNLCYGFVYYLNGTIKNVKFSKLKIEQYLGCGGIVTEGTGYIYNCHVQGGIYCNTHFSKRSVGGICGIGNNIKIERCSVVGSIDPPGSDSMVGGICGTLSDGYINECCNKCNLSGDYNGLIQGGICGKAQNTVIENSYNTGNITTNGIIGSGSPKLSNIFNTGVCTYGIGEGNANNVYYLSGYASKGGGNDNAIAKTSENMKTKEFAERLGAHFIYNEGNYPVLAWEIDPDVVITTTSATTTSYVSTTTTTVLSPVSVNEKNLTLINKEQYTIVPSRNDVTYQSNNKSVAIVSDKGIIIAIGTGNAVISVIDSDSNVSQINVTVKPIPTTTYIPTTTTTTSKITTTTTLPALKATPTSIALIDGEQSQITVNRNNVTYKTNNANVAVVSAKGLITAVGVGNATISVIDSESNVVQIKVTVTPVTTVTTTKKTTTSTTKKLTTTTTSSKPTTSTTTTTTTTTYITTFTTTTSTSTSMTTFTTTTTTIPKPATSTTTSTTTTSTTTKPVTNTEFTPEEFYHEILNENRPKNAEGYRFIDLDGDGKEELLISDDVDVIAIYTCNIQNNKPTSIFTQGTGMYYYTVLGNGIICFNPSPNMHGQAYGHIYYRISDETLIPIVGYIANTYPSEGYYKTDKKGLLSLPLSYDFSEWEEIPSEVFSNEDFDNYVKNDADFKKLNIKQFNPYMESFAYYDAEQEFQRTNQEKPIAVSGQYGYDELIQRYKDLLASPNLLSTIDLAIGTSHLNMDNMSYLWKEEPYTKPCFILRDLNGDGIYEFATGNQENDGSFTLYDLYTIKNNKIIHIASSYVRIRYSINSKNEIIEYNFGGAANSTATSYSLSNGKLKTTGKLIMNDSKCYYYNNFGTAIENKQEITQDEYVEKSNTLFSRNTYQEVILFKDWYKGMSLESLENGDVNGDGQINAVDASTVLAYYAMISTNKDGGFTDAQKTAADVNHDGLINAVDASCILSYYAYVSTTKEEILSLEEYLKK